MVVVVGTLALMLLACAIGRAVRIASGVFALVYVGALAAWPVATAGVVPESLDEPWIWFLVNLATLAAVLAFPLPLQIAWTVLAPLLFLGGAILYDDQRARLERRRMTAAPR